MAFAGRKPASRRLLTRKPALGRCIAQTDCRTPMDLSGLLFVAQQEVRRKRRDSTEIEAKLPELNQQKQLAITAKKFKDAGAISAVPMIARALVALARRCEPMPLLYRTTLPLPLLLLLPLHTAAPP